MNGYNAFILTLPKAIPTQHGGQNIIRYFDPPTRYFAFHVCISYLLDKIYHYIKIILMISWGISAFILTLPKAIPNQGQNIVRYFDWLPSNNQWQSFFVAHICLIRYINILTSWMIYCLNSANAFNFCTTKNYPNLTRGSKYHTRGSKYHDILTPPPHTHTHSNNQLQSFICLLYLLEKMYYYIKIILMIMIYWVFMMLLFCTTNTWFHKVTNYFISCKLKQDTSHHLILFW